MWVGVKLPRSLDGKILIRYVAVHKACGQKEGGREAWKTIVLMILLIVQILRSGFPFFDEVLGQEN